MPCLPTPITLFILASATTLCGMGKSLGISPVYITSPVAMYTKSVTVRYKKLNRRQDKDYSFIKPYSGTCFLQTVERSKNTMLQENYIIATAKIDDQEIVVQMRCARPRCFLGLSQQRKIAWFRTEHRHSTGTLCW